MSHLLVIDNYDSFTYNLVQYFRELQCSVEVVRNDRFALEDLSKYRKIVLSPGPGVPSEAGMLREVISRYAHQVGMLGVCLGHQAIGEVFGGKLLNLPRVYHGVSGIIRVTDREDPLFKGLPDEFSVGRYHSWVVDEPLPECLMVTARDAEGRVMALRHKEYAVWGVQFHPESILTEHGKTILLNWLSAS